MSLTAKPKGFFFTVKLFMGPGIVIGYFILFKSLGMVLGYISVLPYPFEHCGKFCFVYSTIVWFIGGARLTLILTMNDENILLYISHILIQFITRKYTLFMH